MNSAGSVQLMILLLVSSMERPRYAVEVANVIRKAGTRKRVTVRPWNRPASAPTAMAARMPMTTAKFVRPRACMVMTQATPVRPQSEPMDRSMPPTRKTKIVPLVMMPYTLMDQSTLERLLTVGKAFGRRMVSAAKQSTRIRGLVKRLKFSFFIAVPPFTPAGRRPLPAPWTG